MPESADSHFCSSCLFPFCVSLLGERELAGPDLEGFIRRFQGKAAAPASTAYLPATLDLQQPASPIPKPLDLPDSLPLLLFPLHRASGGGSDMHTLALIFGQPLWELLSSSPLYRCGNRDSKYLAAEHPTSREAHTLPRAHPLPQPPALPHDLPSPAFPHLGLSNPQTHKPLFSGGASGGIRVSRGERADKGHIHP